jgi:FtsZ-binding cell division protein ZapB
MADLSKLRKVLDYTPAASMKGWKDRDYYDALNRRLNREVLIERPLAKPARDEAVRVVAPEEWEAARRARETQLLREAELDQTRGELDRVAAREAELEREVQELRTRLEGLRTEAEEKKRKVHTAQLVAVRRPVAPTPEEAPPSPEELAAAGWEVLPDEVVEPAPPEAAPEIPAEWETEIQAAEEAIKRVEHEIETIEHELGSLRREEADLRARAEPYQFEGYTLYRRKVGRGASGKDFYFFSREPPEQGEATPLPNGYEVRTRKGGAPYLKAVVAPRKR